MVITRMMIVYVVPRYASRALKLHSRNIPRSMSHFFVFFFIFSRRYKKREKGSERKIYRRRLRRNQSVDSRNRKVNVEKRKEGKEGDRA